MLNPNSFTLNQPMKKVKKTIINLKFEIHKKSKKIWSWKWNVTKNKMTRAGLEPSPFTSQASMLNQ